MQDGKVLSTAKQVKIGLVQYTSQQWVVPQCLELLRLLTLGGSVTEDKDFNELSIPNDWAKAKESESPQICWSTKQGNQFTAVSTYKFVIDHKNQARL